MIEESFEKGTQMMVKNWEAWQRMFATQHWWPKDVRSSALSQAELCFSSWRSAYEFNSRAWKILRDGLDSMYAKMMRESQLYSQAHGTQVTEFWKFCNESADAHERKVEDMFQRLEDSIKANGGSHAR